MASFEGTTQEFHHYIGPRIKNAVNSLTRKARLERNGVCEFCGEKATLESAHVHGKERREIIESVLVKYIDGNTIIIPDLEKIEHEILDAHHPLSTTFKFICKPCHTEYDSNRAGTHPNRHIVVKSNGSAETNSDFSKLHKIKAWGNKSSQINHKIIQAFRTIEKEHGKVLLSNLEDECTLGTSPFFIGNMGRFSSHLSSMKTDSWNSHGKVFYHYGDEIRIYDVVKDIVKAHFPKL